MRKYSPFFCVKILLEMKKIIIGLILVFSLFLISCNSSQGYMKVEDIPVPEGADAKIPEGSFENQLDNISNQIMQSLKKENKSVEDKIYVLKKDADFSKVSDFFNKTFEMDGYESNEKPTASKNYMTKVWKKSGYFSNEKILVAFITVGKDDSKQNFLNIFLAK